MSLPSARTALTERRAALEEDLERVQRNLAEVRAAKTDQSDDDEHDPEGGTTSAQWSHLTGIRAQVEARLAEVDVALERLDDGTYGVCAACGREISPERLDARPATDRCIDCARAGR